MSLAAVRDGRKPSEPLSWDYILYKWRRMMNASYQDMRHTPLNVIMADLDYINIEEQTFSANT